MPAKCGDPCWRSSGAQRIAPDLRAGVSAVFSRSPSWVPLALAARSCPWRVVVAGVWRERL